MLIEKQKRRWRRGIGNVERETEEETEKRNRIF
jgi:hypothetical protein